MKVYNVVVLVVLSVVLSFGLFEAHAQTSATVENFFGEGSFMDGYDFSAYAIQRWGEEGPDNPGLSPDFYLGDSNYPVITPEYHSPKATIDYGTTSLTSITEIPSQYDSRFANNYFVQGRTYGMYTNEGDYVVIQVTSLYEQPFNDWHKNGMIFNWNYVEGEQTGELTLSLYPLDKSEFAMGESPTIGGDVLLGGQPLANAEVCTEVWGDDLEYMFGVCSFTDASGHFSFWLEYGATIPTGYRGNLTVEGNVSHNGAIAAQVIYVPYGNEALDLPLHLALIGPDHPIEIGSWEDIGIAGTVTSQGINVDGALVTMKVAGQTFQTTTGTHTSGSFNWYWANNSFVAGDYWVEVTVIKDGYQSVTESIPFTLIGAGYDYWVTMDTIPTALPPGNQVPFPGTLTLGGSPVSDWINIYVTFPNGRVNGYSNQTDADGRFTHTQPSLTEVGTYQLVVHYQADDKQISKVYTFVVGATPTPTVIPSKPQPTQSPGNCEIIEVVYPSMILVGEDVNVTGKVICTQGEEILPQEDWNVSVYGTASYQSPVKAPIVQTSEDGSFTATFTANVCYIQELGILARDPELETRHAGWYGPLGVVVGMEPDITLSQTDYDQGEIVEGELSLNPGSFVNNWDSGIEIFYQITGPMDGVAKQYLFEAQYFNHTYIGGVYISTNGITPFSWMIPPVAGAGKYTVTAYISGQNIAAQTVEADFYVNDIQHTNLTAVVEPASDDWSSASLMGQFTDFDGVPIPDADVRVEFLLFKTTGVSEFKLTGTTDQFGNYEIDLEPLDIFAGQGQDDPWQDRIWYTTVYADKERYATGAACIQINTPTVKPRLEIISVDPSLDYLSDLAQSGLSYEALTEMNIRVRVRYNNIFGGGAKLVVSSTGFWASACTEVDNKVTYKPYLSINGDQKPEWEAYTYNWWEVRQNTNSWAIPGLHHLPFYPYPAHTVHMPAQQGTVQESTITVSGRLFGYRYSENSPHQCGSQAYSTDSPLVPPPWVSARPAVHINIGLGASNASVNYNISPPSISTKGSAWASATGGAFNGRLSIGSATGYALANQQVYLSVVAVDIDAGEVSVETEKATDEITIQASAITDEKGELNLPLTVKANLCKLEEKARYFIKVTSSILDGEQYIPIELRCIESLTFEFSDQDISVIQAIDLTDNDPIQLAAGKEAGVRVYMFVDGEIYQPTNSPVQFDVKFELLAGANNTPLFPQIKTVSLSENGVSVRWSPQSRAINDAGIGEILTWGTTPGGELGRELMYVDFVFTPHQLGGGNTEYKIKITVDPGGVYGEAVAATKAGITVKDMQRLQILFVPVDLNPIPMSLILKQVNFLTQAYPLGVGDVGWGIASNFPSAEMTRKFNLSRDTLSWLGQIALNVGERHNASGDTNVLYHIVGVVANDTWMDNQASADALEASAAHFGNGVSLIRDWNQQVDYSMAHEIGHGLGLYQSTVWSSVSKLYLGGKGSEQYDLYEPAGLEIHGLILKNGQIFDISQNFDNTTNTQWRDGFSSTHVGSINVVDLMGNAEGKMGSFLRMAWVHETTYAHLFEKLKDPPGEPIMIVQGGIMEDYSIQFFPVWQTSGLPDNVSEEGEYTLELLSSENEILYTTRFSIYYGKPDSSTIFSIKIPYMPGTARLVISDESQIVGEIIRSSFSPEIQIVSQPVISEDTLISISWTGSDVDTDVLTYSLHYQCDDPSFWFALAADLTETSYSFDVAGLPGGESCVVRVMASDGFNTAEVITDHFSVIPKVTDVYIFVEETHYEAETLILLEGMAYDLEDGIIPNESLRWFSNMDGELGVGSSISVMLSPGTHHLTLRAQDSSGNFSMAEATIQVQSGRSLLDVRENIRLIVGLTLAALLGVGILLLILIFLRNRRKLVEAPGQSVPGGPSGAIQDAQGLWWSQDTSGAWLTWNGNSWQPTTTPLPPAQVPKQRNRGSCLLTLLISGLAALLVFGAVSLVGLNFIPGQTIQPAQSVILTDILKMGGGGFLLSLLGTMMLWGGIKAIITRRAVVEDEMDRRQERRGCAAILIGISQSFFGVLLLSAGLGLMALSLYQQILPWFEITLVL